MHLYHIALNKEIEEIYLNYALSSFAKSMIGIFIPIYLLNISFSIATIILFFVAYFLVFAFGSYPAALFTRKYGAKHAIALSFPFLIIFYGVIWILPQYNLPILLVASIGGFHEAFFWMGLHADFSRFSDRNKLGQQVSILNAIPLIFTITGPVAGALIIAFAGFSILFAISVIILIMSIFPLFLTGDNRKLSRKIKFDMFKRENIRQGVGFIGQGAKEITALIFWPLAIYLALNSTLMLGIAGTLEMLFAAAVTLAIGGLRIKRHRLLASSSITDAISWGFKTLAAYFASVQQIFGISMISGATGAAQNVTFNSLMYEKSKKRTLDYLVFRQAMLGIGRIAFLSIGFVLIISGLSIIFLLALTIIATAIQSLFK